MATGNVPAGDMPMQFYALGADDKPTAAEIQPPPTANQSVTTFMFQTSSRPQSPPNAPFTPFGLLYIGVKEVCGVAQTATSPAVGGVNFMHVTFTPMLSSGMPGTNVDISSAVSASETSSGQMQFVKCVDHLNPWSFNITVLNYGSLTATFTGNLQLSNGTINDFQGSCIGQNDQQISVTQGTPVPTAQSKLLNYDLNVLDNEITPMKSVATGTGANEISSNKDAAQQVGNQIMQNLMMHALDSGGKQILGTIPPIEAHDQKNLGEENMDFFQRGAVHTLCDRIKLDKGMPSSIADHVQWKYNLYMSMLTSPAPPVGATTAQLTWDPAAMYGLNRNDSTDAKTLATLQSQYQKVAMSTYEMGYIQQCSTLWSQFTPDAEYWFNAYSAYLTSPENLAKFAVQSTGQITETVANLKSPIIITGQEKVREWANKLALLQHKAQHEAKKAKKPAPKLDIEPVVDKLMSALHETAGYSQLMNQELIKRAHKMIKESNNGTSNLSQAFQAELAKMSEDARQGGQELYNLIPHILTLLNNPKTAMYQRLRAYIASRSPGGVAPDEISIGQAAEWSVNADFPESAVEAPVISSATASRIPPALLEGDDDATQEINRIGPTWLEKVGAIGKKVASGAVSGVKLLFRVALHVGALMMLYYAVEGDKSSDIPKEQMNTALCALATEGVSIVGDVVGAFFKWKGADWAISKGGLTKTASAWFTKGLQAEGKAGTVGSRVARAMVGDFSKVMRILGLVGCIFNLVTSYNCMNATGQDPDDPNVKNEVYFSKWYFSLGVVEGAAIVGGILSEACGFALGSAVCGPLGMVVGAASIAFMLVEMFKFPPDPYASIEDWMPGLPTQFGSYTPNQTVTGAAILATKPPVVGPGQSGIPVDSHSIVTASQQTNAGKLQTAITAYFTAAEGIDPTRALAISAIFANFSGVLKQVVPQANWLTVDTALTQAWTTLTQKAAAREQKGKWYINVPNTANATNNYNPLLAALQQAEIDFWTTWVNE